MNGRFFIGRFKDTVKPLDTVPLGEKQNGMVLGEGHGIRVDPGHDIRGPGIFLQF